MPKVSELYSYNETLIKEAVDIVIGDNGRRSAEVIEVLRVLVSEEDE
jgi:hypothetical protein